MTEVQKEKNSNLPPKHITFLLSFLLTSAYNPQPMKINIFFGKISGTTGFRPTIVLLRANQKNHIFFVSPEFSPATLPLTVEPENSGLEIDARHQVTILKGAGIYGKLSSSSVARVFQLRCIQYTALHRWKNAETLSKNAKMMFDEAQVFKGLLAWFSASVPTRLRSQWGKKRPNLTIFIL